MSNRRTALTLILISMLFALGACQKQVAAPEYGRPLPPGASALRLLPDEAWPDVKPAFRTAPGDLSTALRGSFDWFNKGSTKQFFPAPGASISHDHAQASVLAFWKVASSSPSPREFEQNIREQFDCYISVGWDGNGVVLFTGYYSPVFVASKTRTGEFRYPLYTKPFDLISDPVTGNVLGRKTGNGIADFPTRSQIESSPDKAGLAGREVAWLKDKFEVYLIHVQGSAKLRLTDGSLMYVGYAGNNGHEYTSVGLELVKDDKLSMNRLSVPGIRNYFTSHPHEMDTYLNKNDRFVFFQQYTSTNWPAGSLGFPVTAFRSLATDKSVFPRGGIVMIETKLPTGTGSLQGFNQFMLDQDTGGAIRAAGRADIYMGEGTQAEVLAGQQYSEGRLYYFFLKSEHVAKWTQQLQSMASSRRR